MSTENAKVWLSRYGYAAVLRRIHKVEEGWKAKGTKTRRNWWEVLAGNASGSPKIIEGVKFPILAAARKRKGWPLTKDSLCLDQNEIPPAIVKQPRWAR